MGVKIITSMKRVFNIIIGVFLFFAISNSAAYAQQETQFI